MSHKLSSQNMKFLTNVIHKDLVRKKKEIESSNPMLIINDDTISDDHENEIVKAIQMITNKENKSTTDYSQMPSSGFHSNLFYDADHSDNICNDTNDPLNPSKSMANTTDYLADNSSDDLGQLNKSNENIEIKEKLKVVSNNDTSSGIHSGDTYYDYYYNSDADTTQFLCHVHGDDSDSASFRSSVSVSADVSQDFRIKMSIVDHYLQKGSKNHRKANEAPTETDEESLTEPTYPERNSLSWLSVKSRNRLNDSSSRTECGCMSSVTDITRASSPDRYRGRNGPILHSTPLHNQARVSARSDCSSICESCIKLRMQKLSNRIY